MGGFTTETGTVCGGQAQRRHLPCVETQVSQKWLAVCHGDFQFRDYIHIYIYTYVCDILYNPSKYIIIKIWVLKYGYMYMYLLEFYYVICTCNMVWWYIIAHDHPQHFPRVVKSRNQSDLRKRNNGMFQLLVCDLCYFRIALFCILFLPNGYSDWTAMSVMNDHSVCS